MTQPPFAGYKPVITLFISFFLLSICQAQNFKSIEWAKDTVSRNDAMGGKNTFLNTVRGSGQNATERVILPVQKLKDIMDACMAHNITDVSVFIVALRQSDIARFRSNNPGSNATDAQLRGSQMLVFRVPRRAFAEGASGATLNFSSSKLMISLLGAGLVMLDSSFDSSPFGAGDVYFSLGTICPPPMSCDAD